MHAPVASHDDASSDKEALARLIQARWSCRGFLPDPVPPEQIREMLVIAQGAASWCNLQPWQLIITEGEATERFRNALYEYASTWVGKDPKDRPEADFPFPKGYEGVYDQRRRETGWALYSSVGVARGDREGSRQQTLENYRLFGAPHVMIVTSERYLHAWGALDCGIYLANLMLAAQSLGIATIAQAAIANCGAFVRDHFHIPDHRIIVCGLSFGFPDPEHPANAFRTTRAEVNDVAVFRR